MRTALHLSLYRLAAVIVASGVVLSGASVAHATPQQSVAAAIDGPVSVTVKAPNRTVRGGKATVDVTTETGHTGTARVWYRSTANNEWGGYWTIPITNGKGKKVVAVSASRAYKVEADVGGTSRIFTISLEDSARRAVTADFSGSTYVVGELGFIRGKAYRNGNAWKSVKVTIQRTKPGSNSWSTMGSITTSSSTGRYTYKLVPSSAFVYRAVISGYTSAKSGQTSLDGFGGDRTLEGRAATLAGVLGTASGSAASVPDNRLPSGVDDARYRDYSNGTLVEVTRDGTVRTWWVTERINSKYKAANRWNSSLGLPTRDMRCGLMESGCLQRLTGGAIYQNSSSKAWIAYGSVDEVELIAVARSQAGYVERSWRKNKYNSWIGASNAWCSVFVSWVGAASGNSSMVPKKASYESYLSHLKASGHLNYSGKPPVGSVVLFDWGSGTPSHTGFVRSHSGSYLNTVEGNTSNGKGSSSRGVYERSRHVNYVWAWYWPHEYAS